MSRTYIFMADGFEDLETLSVVDVFRRAEQEIVMVSINDTLSVTSSHGVTIQADALLSDIDASDALLLVFPGGMPGAKNLAECEPLMQIMQRHFDEGKRIGAICAAPALVLSKLQCDEKMQMTCYPGFEPMATNGDMVDEGVVIDGRVTTAQGPGFAVDFALTLLAQIASPDHAEQVAEGMLI